MTEEQSLPKDETGYIQGELMYTIFHNESEHFSIAKIKIHATNENYDEDEIVGKGYFSKLQEGMVYSFYGTFENHPKFGKQYNIHAYETYIPDTIDGLCAYLSSDLFYGIGKKTAQRIIDYLGQDAITKIIQNPDVVQTIPGLNKETGTSLAKTLQNNQGFEHIVVYFSKYDIGLKMSQKIYEQYKEEAIDILEADPYKYVFDIEGFGFQTADQIAKRRGLSMTHPNRIAAGCLYVMEQSTQNGHVFLPEEDCIAKVLHLLSTSELTADMILEGLETLNDAKKLIIEDERVFLPSLYYAEKGFINHLKRITEKDIESETTLADLMKIIGDIEETEALSYGKEQFSAIDQALHSKLMIITGGPGTGKTTVIKGILHAYATIHDTPYDINEYKEKSDYPFVLTAPTGRAAKRLTESTGLPATTIHRLLGWNGQDHFDKNEHEPLTGKYLIIDEFSMVDIWLANQLFQAIPDDMQVLIVGDEDQLPSVGPGQVLTDLLSSSYLPYVRLTEVYRQQEGSKIIQLAHEIKNGTCSIESLNNDKDFSFINCRDFQVTEVITTVVKKAEAKGVDLRQMQVLAPMYRTQAGITEINRQLQEIINPKKQGKREKKFKDAIYRVGDKVIQLVNQPEDGISNGDIGEIVAMFNANENVDKVEQIVIDFDGREIAYERKDYVNFMHAYCISIHKSQGSEFPIVILPVVPTYRRMLRKNLLYTAITRGKQSLIICGHKQAFLQGIQTQDTNKRFSSLREQLTERFEMDISGNEITDEMSEEEALSPYDFM